MTQKYPNDCPQAFTENWWIRDEKQELDHGRLLWAFVPHVDQVPMALVPKGRTQATEHHLVDCEVVPAHSNNIFQRSSLPVAAIPCHKGEVRTVYRSKVRPVLLIVPPCEEVPKTLMSSKPKRLTKATALVAPFFGRDEGTGKRAGFSEAFVNRVKHCEYPRFIWDKLPIDGAEESILRLDHLLPMSTLEVAFKKTPWKLSEEAFFIVKEWFEWYYLNRLPERKDSMLPVIRIELLDQNETP
jgi:hypothetical protein